MEWVETTGRTVTEALETALDRLGVDEREAEIQILDEPQKGLFGRLRVEARVRARVRPTAPRAKPDRRDRRRRDSDRKRKKGRGPQSGGGASSAPSSETAPSGQAGGGQGKRPARDDRSRKQGQQAKAGKSAHQPQASTESGDAAGPKVADGEVTSSEDQHGQETQEQRSTNSRKRRRGSGGGRAQQGANVAAEASQVEGQESSGGPSLDIEPQREAVGEFLGGLLTALGRPEASVSTSLADGDTIIAEVNGDELGLLVGPKGQTLQAVHELTRSVVQRRFVGESHARLELDVAGYRKRRAEALARFTRDVADKVLASGKAVALEPMSGSDRKVVHDVVNEIEGVRTCSEGEDPDRRVVIELD